MKKLIDKKGNPYYRVFCLPEKTDGAIKGLNIYDKGDGLLFFRYHYNAANPQKSRDPEFKLLLSFKNNRVNLYKLNGKVCINITTKPGRLDFYVNSVLDRFVVECAKTSKLNRFSLEISKRAKLIKFLKGYAKDRGFKVPNFNCRKTSFSAFIVALAYRAYPLKKITDKLPKQKLRLSGRQTWEMDNLVSKHLRRETPSLAVQSLLKKGYKKVARIVEERDTYIKTNLKAIMIFKNLTTIDFLQKFLSLEKNSVLELHNKEEVKNYRAFLKNFNEKRLEVLLINQPWHAYELRDAVRQWIEKKEKIVLPDKPKSMTELHDYISKEYRKLQHEKYDLPVLPNYEHVLGQIPDHNLVVVAPKDSHELVDWGGTLNNCIASYASSAKARHVQLLGIIKEDKLTYALELTPSGMIRQFYGHSNRSPNDEDNKTVREHIDKCMASQTEV